MNTKKSAFTLVELIVVIGVLSVLSTIAFVSFSGYNSNSRDSVRVTDFNNLTVALEQSVAKTYTLPKPGTSIEIKVGSTVTWYQWYADKNVLDTIALSNAKDPLDGVYYTYATNVDLTKYQLLWFLENSDSLTYFSYNKKLTLPEFSIIPSAHAEPATYANRFIVSKWNQLGVFLNPVTFLPIQTNYNASTFTSLDIANTTSSYVSILNNTSTGKITGTGSALASINPASSCKRIFESGIGKVAGEYTLVTNTITYQAYCVPNYTDKIATSELLNTDAEYGSNQYWGGNTTVQASDAHSGNYTFKSTWPSTIFSSYYIPIDTTKTYKIEGWFKSVWVAQSKLYFGYAPYDGDFRSITGQSVIPYSWTETELYEPVIASDTIVKLVNKWNTCTNIGGVTYFSNYASIAFDIDTSWNYWDLPNFNTSPSTWFASIVDNGAFCTLTTKSAVWKIYPVGTKTRIHSSGGYAYVAAANTPIPTTWTKYEATISWETLYWASNTKFWKGTKYVKFLILSNYQQSMNEVLLFDDLKITRL